MPSYNGGSFDPYGKFPILIIRNRARNTKMIGRGGRKCFHLLYIIEFLQNSNWERYNEDFLPLSSLKLRN